MLKLWSDVTLEEGTAAHATAHLAKEKAIPDGFVLPAAAMGETFDERTEQIESLLKVRDGKNDERIATELKRTILTMHVPREVQLALEDALERLGSPVTMRLSNVGSIADPLSPTIVIGLRDIKAMLDALRMLYAEMYSVKNLETEDHNRSAAIIIQKMPSAVETYRILRGGAHTIIEGTRGFGSWVGFGEPDRFLFENDAFAHTEHGDTKGVAWNVDAIDTFKRTPLGGEDAQALLTFANEYLTRCEQPLLLGKDASGFFCLGALPAIPKKKE